MSLALLLTLTLLAIAGPAVAHVALSAPAPATILPVTEAPAAIPEIGRAHV